MTAKIEEAGLPDPDSGELGRPVQLGELLVPSVIYGEAGMLIWESRTQLDLRSVRSDTRMLGRFMRLAHAPDEKVLKFAKRYGVLALCGCGLPHTHCPPVFGAPYFRWNNDRYEPRLPAETPPDIATGQWELATELSKRQESERRIPCFPTENDRGQYTEPIERWRGLATQFQSLADIAAKLHLGQLATDEEWHSLAEWSHGQFTTVENQRWKVASVVQAWLGLGDLEQAFFWFDDLPVLRLGTRVLVGRLWASLALQLALAVAKIPGMAQCSACGSTYPTRRKPRYDRPNHCPECRGEPTRQAKARQRARDRNDPDAPRLRQPSRRKKR